MGIVARLVNRPSRIRTPQATSNTPLNAAENPGEGMPIPSKRPPAPARRETSGSPWRGTPPTSKRIRTTTDDTESKQPARTTSSAVLFHLAKQYRYTTTCTRTAGLASWRGFAFTLRVRMSRVIRRALRRCLCGRLRWRLGSRSRSRSGRSPTLLSGRLARRRRSRPARSPVLSPWRWAVRKLRR